MPSDQNASDRDYMTVNEIADHLGVKPDKIRTIIARLGIQPTRFPGDLRKLYYSSRHIEQVKRELNRTAR